MEKSQIEFYRNDKKVSLDNVSPTQSLLDYLRLEEKSFGTKEGCAEGDCGACSVVLGKVVDGELQYRAVNSCIFFVGMADGQQVITVDDLADKDGKLHPVQQAMVDKNGSQCGFCTPGFVMALFALYHSDQKADRTQITDQLAGNLCRCTGYRPIVEAAMDACNQEIDDQFDKNKVEMAKMLSNIPNEDLFIGNQDRFFASPKSLDSLLAIYKAHPDATLVSGATDVGLWVTKGLMDLPKIIFVSEVAELKLMSENDDTISIGAGLTYAEVIDQLGALDADLYETMRRIGSKQVRASGTVGGNIANGSPIGDMPPMLIAMDAKIKLQSVDAMRDLNIENFFIDYGKQDIGEAEVLTQIRVPKLKANQHFRAYKISKRFDQDISAVMAAFRFELEGNKIVKARIAFGGMAATPKRASNMEAALVGKNLDDIKQSDAIFNAMAQDYTPMTDMRASSDYRLNVAKNLCFKAIYEVAQSLNNENAQMRVLPRYEGAAS